MKVTVEYHTEGDIATDSVSKARNDNFTRAELTNFLTDNIPRQAVIDNIHVEFVAFTAVANGKRVSAAEGIREANRIVREVNKSIGHDND